MDGVFMKKCTTFLTLLLFCGSIFAVGKLISERENLQQQLIRLHVVASSDSDHDQRVKLSIRDAVLDYLQPILDDVTDAQLAKNIVSAHMTEIETVANQTLALLGEAKQATVSFMKEEFPVREYDSFSLPSGIYDSLRIVIGEGEGKNWWCVVFPKMCYSTSVKDVTAGAGFSDGLTGALTGEYKVSFYLLDVLGKVENFLHRG